MKYDLDDTIVAISTPAGEGGIGIVRLSGRGSLSVADKIFRSKNDRPPSGFESYTTHYGHIVKENEMIDEVLLTVMKAPKSYTKEDIVEINCHGGIVPLKRILGLVLSMGPRAAEPGEFTKRAFLNGRIDLAQAESVLDIIRSKTDKGLRAAMSQLEGDFSRNVRAIREELVGTLSNVEASIDFPDEDTEVLAEFNIKEKLTDAAGEIKSLLDSSDKGRILTEGIRTVICGRANVGKSSLMNALLREKRVIVSHIPGTTRDAVEEILNIDGIPLRIADTAGIIDSDDSLTMEGVAKSRFHISAADLVFFLLDGSAPLTADDMAIMGEIKDKKAIVVINKVDLPMRLDAGEVENHMPQRKIVEISATERKGLGKLEGAIKDMIWGGDVSANHSVLVTNQRHKALLGSAGDLLQKALKGVNEKTPSEFIALDIREAVESLGEITGETIDEEILERIFSNFCIGK